MRHLGHMCTQGLLNYIPFPTPVVLAGAQGLLDHCTLGSDKLFIVVFDSIFPVLMNVGTAKQ